MHHDPYQSPSNAPQTPMVAEVTAVYGTTVLDIQHIHHTTQKAQSKVLWLGMGITLLIAGIGLFSYDVAQDWSHYRQQSIDASIRGDTQPEVPGTGMGGLGALLCLLGLIPLSLGLLPRSAQRQSSYTIGEGPGVSLTTPSTGLPSSDCFSLVSMHEGQLHVHFSKQMEGSAELINMPQVTQLDDATYALPLAWGNQYQIYHQGVRFSICPVHAAAIIPYRHKLDKPFWFYNGGSAVAIGSLILLSQLLPDHANILEASQDLENSRFVAYIHQPQSQTDFPSMEDDHPSQEAGQGDGIELDSDGAPGQAAQGPEGQMGNPNAAQVYRRAHIQGPSHAIPSFARTYDPTKSAAQAGILGLMQQEQGHFIAQNTANLFTVGKDEDAIWGNLIGQDVGEAYGVGAVGLVGIGRMGGGNGNDVIGVGSFQRTQRPGHASNPHGDRSGVPAFSDRTPKPPVEPGRPVLENEQLLGKDIIRRVVRSHINEVRHCYQQGLSRNPSLRGRVAIHFQIGGSGKVLLAQVQESTVKDANVGNCITSTVKRWQFPKPHGGGMVGVSYPFVFNPG